MTPSDESPDLLDLRSELERVTREKDQAEARWASLRDSRWHRVGRVLHQARRPRAWRRLAGDLTRELRRPTRTAATTGGAVALVGAATTIPDGPIRRPEIKVAAILDTFSALAFQFEWDVDASFGPRDWETALVARRPDLLFVESAWQGNEGAWRLTMSAADAPRSPLRELVAWCRAQGIPTVFWNKEDPPNFERFIETAKLFDRVLTVDEDCVPRYVAELGHDRVGVLPFAAAPRVHNPTAVVGGRSHEVAFGGTYFAEKHPARREQMEIVVAPARAQGLHIFSRQDGTDERYTFPAEYQSHVVGTLDYPHMLTAYKRYKVFLNVNSVVTSPSMCARRVFELSACRTPVVSGPSEAIPAFFGDLVPVVTSADETTATLQSLLRHEELRERLAHRAMRHVMSSHTYGHRADDVLRAAGIAFAPVADDAPMISVLLATNRPTQVAHAIEQVARQHHGRIQLVLTLHGDGFDADAASKLAKEAGLDDTVVVEVPADVVFGAALNLGLEACDGDLVAKMDDDDLYGPHYLTDLAHAFLYTDAQIVGKSTHYVHLQGMGATLLRFVGSEHRYTYNVKGATLLARADTLRDLRFAPLPRAIDSDLLARCKDREIPVYATDRYNFAAVRHADTSHHTWQISEADLLRSGRIALYGPPEPHILV